MPSKRKPPPLTIPTTSTADATKPAKGKGRRSQQNNESEPLRKKLPKKVYPDPQGYYDTLGWGRDNGHTSVCDECRGKINKNDANPAKDCSHCGYKVCWHCETTITDSQGRNPIEVHETQSSECRVIFGEYKRGENLEHARAVTGYNQPTSTSRPGDDPSMTTLEKEFALEKLKQARDKALRKAAREAANQPAAAQTQADGDDEDGDDGEDESSDVDDTAMPDVEDNTIHTPNFPTKLHTPTWTSSWDPTAGNVYRTLQQLPPAPPAERGYLARYYVPQPQALPREIARVPITPDSQATDYESNGHAE